MTTLIAEAICARAERGGMSIPLMPIICSTRDRASRGVLAWTVVIDPSWPVFIAWSMSNASPARTSPTMIRSGRMRSAFLTRSRWAISPLPSMLAGRVSSRATCSCCSWSSAESSIVTIRSRSSMNADMALSSVVLPEPVPPEMRTLRRAATIAFSTSATWAGTLPISISRSMLIGTLANLRIDSSGAVDRQRRDDRVDAAAVGQAGVDHRRGFVDPPADRRDDLLDDPEQVPLVLEAHRRRLEHAVALDEHAVVAVDQDVGDRRVLEQRLERPEAEQFVEHVVDQLLALGMVERVVLLGQLLEDDVADFVLDLLARHGFERGQVDEVEQALVQLDLEVGVQLVLGEGAGIAGRYQPALFLGPLGYFLGRNLILGLANLPHGQRSRPRAPAMP